MKFSLKHKLDKNNTGSSSSTVIGTDRPSTKGARAGMAEGWVVP